MNAQTKTVVPLEQQSILATVAARYSMSPQNFEQTLRATVVPEKTTREQFAAFLVVANEYSLNPLTKEIYAFPAKGGGIVPIVSIDGWLNIINSHPMLNGIEFDDHQEGDKVPAITARIWRKDREKPIVVTEYLAECQRQTEPWKQYPRRMLRHKALIQCARYAFGFAGIVDPDEAERMGADVSGMRDVSPRRTDGPPPPSAIEHKPPATNGKSGHHDVDLIPGEAMDASTGEVTWSEPPTETGGIPDFLDRAKTASKEIDEAQWLKDLAGAFSGCEDMVSFGQKQRDVMATRKGSVSGDAWTRAQHLAEDAFKRIQAAS